MISVDKSEQRSHLYTGRHLKLGRGTVSNWQYKCQQPFIGLKKNYHRLTYPISTTIITNVPFSVNHNLHTINIFKSKLLSLLLISVNIQFNIQFNRFYLSLNVTHINIYIIYNFYNIYILLEIQQIKNIYVYIYNKI